MSQTETSSYLSSAQKGILIGIALFGGGLVGVQYFTQHCHATSQRIQATFNEPIPRSQVLDVFRNLAKSLGYYNYSGPGFGVEAQSIKYFDDMISHRWFIEIEKRFSRRVVQLGPMLTWAHQAEYLDGFIYDFKVPSCGAPSEYEQAEIDRWESAIREKFPEASFNVQMRGGYLQKDK